MIRENKFYKKNIKKRPMQKGYKSHVDEVLRLLALLEEPLITHDKIATEKVIEGIRIAATRRARELKKLIPKPKGKTLDQLMRKKQ